jgi:hypothetical protein
MRETSVEDLNCFDLLDNGLYARFTLRF